MYPLIISGLKQNLLFAKHKVWIKKNADWVLCAEKFAMNEYLIQNVSNVFISVQDYFRTFIDIFLVKIFSGMNPDSRQESCKQWMKPFLLRYFLVLFVYILSHILLHFDLLLKVKNGGNVLHSKERNKCFLPGHFYLIFWDKKEVDWPVRTSAHVWNIIYGP